MAIESSRDGVRRELRGPLYVVAVVTSAALQCGGSAHQFESFRNHTTEATDLVRPQPLSVSVVKLRPPPPANLSTSPLRWGWAKTFTQYVYSVQSFFFFF